MKVDRKDRVAEESKGAWMRRLAVCVVLTGSAGLTAWTSTGSVARGADLGIHAVDLPYIEALWSASPHANAEAEAFKHWDEENPPQVPPTCAKCHSAPGYVDFLGADGTEAGKVDNPAPIGTVIDCTACHNEVTAALRSVTFPSGIEVKDLGAEARCLTCHQGRASKASVDSTIDSADLQDPNQADTADPNLRFSNIHYLAAAATQYGGVTKGGYQYDGKSYDVKFAHVQGIDSCVDCHDQHSLDIRVEACATCHQGVQTAEDLRTIRMPGSLRDYDGDGDMLEGIAGEIEGLQQALYAAMQTYATNAGTPIVYDSHAHPYFFSDPNGNGRVDEGEGGYASWTPRLLKAAYNYQLAQKDPGAFAHNAKYVIQLLFDSIEDLSADRAVTLARNDVGHFAGSEEPWRHWDEEGKVPGTCSKCHSAVGLPFWLEEGVAVSQPLSNGLLCTTCHNAMPEFTRHEVKTVQFPSGAKLDTGHPDSNLCLNCHQGRASAAGVNSAIAGLDLDTVSATLRFQNVHYLPAGATLFGTQAKGMYEYEGKTYQGRLTHRNSFDTCTECHDAHTLEVNPQPCATPICHGGAQEVRNIRKDVRDFDGDGSRAEGLAGEIDTLAATLLSAMTDYAKQVVGKPLAYDSSAYPYFFNDDNGNGQVDEGETGYASWTPRLLRAAYNYQYVQKEPGAFAHNGKYVIQVLHDGLQDLSTKVPVVMNGMIRP